MEVPLDCVPLIRRENFSLKCGQKFSRKTSGTLKLLTNWRDKLRHFVVLLVLSTKKFRKSKHFIIFIIFVTPTVGVAKGIKIIKCLILVHEQDMYVHVYLNKICTVYNLVLTVTQSSAGMLYIKEDTVIPPHKWFNLVT